LKGFAQLSLEYLHGQSVFGSRRWAAMEIRGFAGYPWGVAEERKDEMFGPKSIANQAFLRAQTTVKSYQFPLLMAIR